MDDNQRREKLAAEVQLGLYLRQLEILKRLDTELMHRLDIAYVLAISLDAALRLGNADAGAILLMEEQGLRLAHVIGEYPKELTESHVSPERGIVGRVIRRQEPEMVLDVLNDPDYLIFVPNTRAQITVPLVANDKPIGAMNIQTSKPGRFTQESLEFVQLVGTRAAVAIENARLYEQSQDQLEELKELYARVSALEQMKSDMIRIAAHDLRNPLTNILSAVALLEETKSAQEQELVNIIYQSVDRMKHITSDILSLERIEHSASEKLPGVLNLGDLAQRIFTEYERQALNKHIRMHIHPWDEVLRVPGDEAQLYEVAANLVGNAIKYTPDEGQVDIYLKQEGSRAVLEVVDTGYGIPEKDHARLFQPFFRAQTPETREIEGTGLGLHLVKRVIERHKGRMRFKSDYGKGSTFGFALPLASEDGF